MGFYLSSVKLSLGNANFSLRNPTKKDIQVFSSVLNTEKKGGAYCLRTPKCDHNKHLNRSRLQFINTEINRKSKLYS